MRTRKRNLALLAACSLLLFIDFGCRRCKSTNSSSSSSACTATPGSDSDTTPQDTPKLINVLANDTVSQNGTSSAATTIASVTSPTAQGGTAVISGTQILYTPPPNRAVTTTVVKNISTGIDDATGAKLAEGASDTDYIIVSGGTGGDIGAVPVVERNSFPPGYVGDGGSTTSAWLFLKGDGLSGYDVPLGTYYFQIQVNAAGFDPATMQIVGLQVAEDDQLTAVYVNNVLVVPSQPIPNPAFNFVSFGNVGLGAFHSGINTVTFVVNNVVGDTEMALRVEGTVQANTTAGPTAPFTDTFNYTISDPCGTASAAAAVTVNVTAPIGAAVSVVNNSKAQITVSVGGAQVDVVQPLGMTIVPQNVAAGANQQIRVDAINSAPQSNSSTSTTANLTPNRAYTITYSDSGNGTPTIGVAP